MSDLTITSQDLGLGPLFESLPEAVIVTNAETGRIVLWNPAASEVFGYQLREVLNVNVEAIIPEYDRVRRAVGTSRATDHGPRVDPRAALELPAVCKGGKEIRVELTLSLVEPAPGAGTEDRFVIAIARDVTRRKRAEKNLEENERRFRNTFENAPIGMGLVSLDNRYLRVNRALCEMLGYSEEVLLSKSTLDITHPDDREASAARTRALLEGEIDVDLLEKRYIRADGGVVWAIFSVSLVRDSRGDADHFVAQYQNITGRKEAEGRLGQAETRYRNLVERMPAVVYVQEIGGPDAAAYMSPRIEALTGYTPEECQDPDLRWRMVHPEDRGSVQSEDERTGEPGEVFATEYRVVRRDGRVVWVRNESVVVEDEASGSRYWQGFMVDITERVRAEEALRNAEERYRTLVERIPAVTFVDRAEGSDASLYVSPQIEEMLGYTPE
ncbi:MAG: PAS domain S-box protein, partial [Actinomycetota bacterium]|nr:PAS domain S-box protein [Actinomycetota bacterium]